MARTKSTANDPFAVRQPDAPAPGLGSLVEPGIGPSVQESTSAPVQKSKVINVDVPFEAWEALRTLAGRQDTTLRAWCRQAILDELARQQAPAPGQTADR